MNAKYQFRPLARGSDDGKTAREGLRKLANDTDVTAFVAITREGDTTHVIGMANDRAELLAMLAMARHNAEAALNQLMAEDLAAIAPAGVA